jgi:hypothetical protein
MAARDKVLLDAVLRRAEKHLGVEDLLLGRNIVRLAGPQIRRAGYVLQVQPATEADEASFGETVLLEELDDRLKIPAARQIDRVLLPAFEGLFLPEIGGVVDVLINVLFDMVFLGVRLFQPPSIISPRI